MTIHKEKLKIVVVGNCFVMNGTQATRSYLPNATVDGCSFNHFRRHDLRKMFSNADLIIKQLHIPSSVNDAINESSAIVADIPRVVYQALFPDCVSAMHASKDGNRPIKSVLGLYNSAIVLHAWRNSWTVEQTILSFNKEVFDYLGYFDMVDESNLALINECNNCDFPVEDYLDNWIGKSFMYTPNHQRLFVSFDIIAHVLDKLGIERSSLSPESTTYDAPWYGHNWAIYPHVADVFGLHGKYAFKTATDHRTWQKVEYLNLRQMVEKSFQSYEALEKDKIICDQIDTARFRALEPGGNKFFRTNIVSVNPYRGLPDNQFWRKAVAEILSNDVDPVHCASFEITTNTRIATAGSCFAQHIARVLKSWGYNYVVYEAAPSGMSDSDAIKKNYGVFSARYGNLYTARQLKQLIYQSFNQFKPKETIWKRSDGRFIDPFRPQIDPDGFESVAELERSRETLFAAVRTLIFKSDIFVFTLGLTESWKNIEDGAVYPLAPGVAGGVYDPNKHVFVNFSVAEIIDDLEHAISAMLRFNSNMKIILTVSPVPLIATYENQHVLTATTYSKSVLRTAADEIAQRFPCVTYFPSYEIITGNFNRGAYFDDDLRSVTEDGVNHVMKLFLKHFIRQGRAIPVKQNRPTESRQKNLEISEGTRKLFNVVCDEEVLDK